MGLFRPESQLAGFEGYSPRAHGSLGKAGPRLLLEPSQELVQRLVMRRYDCYILCLSAVNESMTFPKRGVLSPTFIFPMAGIGLLVGAFVYYYFPARAQREALHELAFRELGTLGTLVQDRILIYSTVLGQWAGERQKRNEVKPAEAPGSMPGFADQVPDLRYAYVKGSKGTDLELSTRSDKGRAVLWLQYGVDAASIPIETVVAGFVKGEADDLFDEILVCDHAGSVLFQTRTTGLQVANLLSVGNTDSISVVKPGSQPGASPATPSLRGSNIITVPLGGAQYRLYSSPLPIRVSGSGTAPSLDWTVYGLISETRMRSRVLATPGSVLILIWLAVSLVVFAAWPLLKFSTMRAGERVPRRAGVYFLATTAVTIILSLVLGILFLY